MITGKDLLKLEGYDKGILVDAKTDTPVAYFKQPSIFDKDRWGSIPSSEWARRIAGEIILYEDTYLWKELIPHLTEREHLFSRLPSAGWSRPRLSCVVDHAYEVFLRGDSVGYIKIDEYATVRNSIRPVSLIIRYTLINNLEVVEFCGKTPEEDKAWT